nr:adenylyl-sulfate kinase [Rhizobium lemnae]
MDCHSDRSDNTFWQHLIVDRTTRALLKSQRPRILWFTGLSGAGKTTIANHVDMLLCASGKHTFILDGDNLRHGLNQDLGFTIADRIENIRRTAHVAKLMADAGLIVVVCLISPYRQERRMARDLMEPGEFVEIFVDTPLEICAERDPKGLYKKAYAGEIRNFTGVDEVYECPVSPELHLRTVGTTPIDLATQIVAHLDLA